MPSIAKPILIIAGIIASAFALVVLCLNLILQSEGIQANLRQAVFKATGTEPVLAKTYYTPWSGITLSGIKIPQSGNPKKPLLTIKSVNCHVDLLPLLKGQVVIKKTVIQEPSLIVVQGQSQVWPISSAFPFQRIDTSSHATRQTTSSTDFTTSPTPAPGSTVETAQEPTPSKPNNRTPERLSPSISGIVRIHKGDALFYPSPQGQPIKLEGFVADGHFAQDGSLSGNFRTKSILIAGIIQYTDVIGHFDYFDGNLKIKEVDGNWAAGKLHATMDMTFERDASVSGSINAENISLKKLAEEAGFSAEGLQGTLLANATLQGIPGRPESFKGYATASLTEARMQPIDPIRQIGDMLRINELRMLELRNARTALTIRDGKILVDCLEFETANLVMDANGEARFDGTLDLAARLHVTDALLKKSFGFLGSKFQPSDRDGYAHMPFSINGTIARPKSDLLDKLVGVRLGDDVGGLLKNLFRVPKKEKDNKNTNQATPTATPK